MLSKQTSKKLQTQKQMTKDDRYIADKYQGRDNSRVTPNNGTQGSMHQDSSNKSTNDLPNRKLLSDKNKPD